MSSKRTISQRTGNLSLSLAKKVKTVNYFHKTLEESGLILKNPPDKCLATQETVYIIRNIKQKLESHLEYPINVTEFYSNLKTECENMDIFRYYLYPNIVRASDTESADDHLVNDSVIKILLNIPILQKNLIKYILEKLTDLASLDSCGPWIQMALKCLSTLNCIVDNDESVTSDLINLLEIASEKIVRLEIITAIPDIVGEQAHDNIATELCRILEEDHELIPAILECLSHLSLSDEKYLVIQKDMISILEGLSKCNYFPKFVKFLLIPNCLNESAYFEAVQGLRNALGWSTTILTAEEIASSQVLTALEIRNSMVSSKGIANAWMKVVSNHNASADHKPIDIVILLILYSTSDKRKKQVENIMRKKIKLEIFDEELLTELFDSFKPILTDNFQHLTNLTNSLLKSAVDPEVQSFASCMYTLMFSKLEDHRQKIVAVLLKLSLESKQCIMSILLLFNNIASKDIGLLDHQSVQMLTLLDRMDDMPPAEIRAVMNLLCTLAYSTQDSAIRNDMFMIISKELGSSEPNIKMRGILAGIHAVKYLMTKSFNTDTTQEMPDNVSYSCVNYLPEGDLREAAQIIELISRSTKRLPLLAALFYDELSEIILEASDIDNNFLEWLTDAVTNDFLQNFIEDSLETEQIGALKLNIQFCLNADSEVIDVILINIAGLTLQPRNDINVGILSPLLHLVQSLHTKKYGQLSKIDAILGCGIVMPNFDEDSVNDMDPDDINKILDCLVHCGNWFRELLNTFATQTDSVLTAKLLQRLEQIEEIDLKINKILIRSKMSYKPPCGYFDYNSITGEHVHEVIPKAQKKNANDTLSETLKSQPVTSVKNKIYPIPNINYRQLNLNLLKLLKLDLTRESGAETKLTVQSLYFILKGITTNLDSIMVSKIKRKTFFSKQKDTLYDPKKAEECARAVSEILPHVSNHIEFITDYIENNLNVNTQSDDGFLYTSEFIDYTACLENIYNMLTTFLKWMGFRNHHNSLLVTSLKCLASNNVTNSLKDLTINIAEKFKNHEKYCLKLSTAASLIEFISVVQGYSNAKYILKLSRNMAHSFLTQLWKTPNGAQEKGQQYTQIVSKFTSIYVINNDISELKNLSLELINDIQNLKSRNDTLSTLKCITKANFHILYRNLGIALHENLKNVLNKGMTNAEHLTLWKDVALILKSMADIGKIYQEIGNRYILPEFLKKSLPVLKLFSTQGMPIMKLEFKRNSQQILDILKTMQQSTRFMQTLCCHSRLKKNTVLMSKVPMVKQTLETLLYKVKALLAANNCSEAFWLGTLQNKDINGEIIQSQQSVQDESGEDSEDDLPEDEESQEKDEEMPFPASNSLSDLLE